MSTDKPQAISEERINEMVSRALGKLLKAGEGEPGQINRRVRRKVSQPQRRQVPVEVERARANTDTRTVPFVASNERVDRMGDIIRVKGWQLQEFRRNPVFLFGHRSDMEPIGRAVSITRSTDPLSLVMDVRFPTEEESPLGARVWKLYRGGYMNAVSVGFQPLETLVITDDEERSNLGLGKYGVVYTKQDLLELSAVSIPANPDALQLTALTEMVKEGEWTDTDCDALHAEGALTEAVHRCYRAATGNVTVSLPPPGWITTTSDNTTGTITTTNVPPPMVDTAPSVPHKSDDEVTKPEQGDETEPKAATPAQGAPITKTSRDGLLKKLAAISDALDEAMAELAVQQPADEDARSHTSDAEDVFEPALASLRQNLAGQAEQAKDEDLYDAIFKGVATMREQFNVSQAGGDPTPVQ